MKARNKIIFTAAVIAVTGLLIYAAKRQKKTQQMLAEISDQGYETAPDIIFPGKEKRNSKLKYGPVLPV
jgi:hypothetical protein